MDSKTKQNIKACLCLLCIIVKPVLNRLKSVFLMGYMLKHTQQKTQL